jgi:site-specific DNA recombinase
MTSAAEGSRNGAVVRAGIYSRVSTVLQRSKGHFGLDAQSDDCDTHAARLGAVVVGRWADEESGSRWDLPGLNAMFDAARRGEFEILIVPEPDRFARNMTKQLVLEEELRRAGVRVEYARYRLDDTAEGRLLKNQLSAFAEYEREKITFRMARGKRAKAERGLVVGNGPAPYGYRYVYSGDGKVQGLEPDPETAPILRRIFRDAARMSLQDLCRALNAEGVPTPRTVINAHRKREPGAGVQDRKRARPSGRWMSSSLRCMLNHPVYVGTLPYRRWQGPSRERNPEEWIMIAVPPLVTPEEVEAAKAATAERRTHRAPKRYTSEDDPYVLRGMLSCPQCGGQLACLPNSGIRYYACVRSQPYRARKIAKPVCSQPAARADALEAVAWITVASTLLNRDALRAGLSAARAERTEAGARITNRQGAIDAKIAVERVRLGNLAGQLADLTPGSDGAIAVRQKMTEIERTLAGFRAERAEADAVPLAGLSDTEAESLEAFADEIREGIGAATPRDQRRLFEILRLRGVVRLARDDEPGIRLGRRLRRFTVDWKAAVAMKTPDSGRKFESLSLLFSSPVGLAPVLAVLRREAA